MKNPENSPDKTINSRILLSVVTGLVIGAAVPAYHASKTHDDLAGVIEEVARKDKFIKSLDASRAAFRAAFEKKMIAPRGHLRGLESSLRSCLETKTPKEISCYPIEIFDPEEKSKHNGTKLD